MSYRYKQLNKKQHIQLLLGIRNKFKFQYNNNNYKQLYKIYFINEIKSFKNYNRVFNIYLH